MRINAKMAASLHLEIALGCNLSQPCPVSVGNVAAALLATFSVIGPMDPPTVSFGHGISGGAASTFHSAFHVKASRSTSS
jgi:hypothetical protein